MGTFLKWAAVSFASLAAVAALAVGAAYAVFSSDVDNVYAVAATPIPTPTDAAHLAEGRRLMRTRGCVDCHGEDLSGKVFIDEPPLGRIVATNLTRGKGGLGQVYTEAEYARAIRNGIRKDGKSVIFMPSQEYYTISDEDIAAMVAYIKSAPPVDQELPATRVGPVGRVLYATGQMKLLPAAVIDHASARLVPPARGVTPAYGAYLAASCAGCHGERFSGGPVPGGPPGVKTPVNLTPDPATGLGAWTEADFFRALREGKRPDGSALDPWMPWKLTRELTDDEIRAMWLFFKTLPPTPEGNR